MSIIHPDVPKTQLDRANDGRTFRRGSPGYEERRQASMWNARVPDRYPDVIVRAKDERDVVSAVKLARREGLRLSVRSGGHSWSGNHLRDGGLLLDVSALREVTIDREKRRATTGPGRAGNELADMLGRQSLFFPTGHCKGVCVGGYLLQGGFGWHGRALGPACMSVVGLDLVTPDGEMVHASAEENADLYWAARGSGPGFFCVVTRFHLRVYEKPAVTGFAFQSFPMSRLDEVFRWAHAVGPEVSAAVELQLVLTRNAVGVGGPGIEVFAPVFADTARATFDALRFMNESALARTAAARAPFVPAPLPLLYRAVMHHYPDDYRYAVDNMWTHAPIDDLLPGLHRIAETLPPPPAHVLWLNWAPPPDRPDSNMAFSMEDQVYIALYAGWRDVRDDGLHDSWATERMREMQHLASGCQLADENLGKRPARFVKDENLARLDRIRDKRDPKGLFHPWMGRP